jgi:uncharacterized YigZ family protein
VNGALPDTIARTVRSESVATRSRFIATLAPVADEAAADDVIATIRREFHDARHHCTAMVLGPDGQRQRSNDDGEPAGTAGAPMLAVLRGAELTDVVAVVTRYFGGTLLGAGGLVRAYGAAVHDALELARRRVRRHVEVIDIQVGHEDAGRLEHRLRTWSEQQPAAHPVGVGDGRYTADGARFELTVPTELLEELATLLASAGIAHQREDEGSAIREMDLGGGA